MEIGLLAPALQDAPAMLRRWEAFTEMFSSTHRSFRSTSKRSNACGDATAGHLKGEQERTPRLASRQHPHGRWVHRGQRARVR